MRRINHFNVAMTADEVMKELGLRVSEHRLSLNWTQKELAERSGLSLSTIIRLESGVGSTRLEAFASICMALNLTSGFESLLPEVKMMPQEVIKGVKMRQRARKSANKVAWKLGCEE